MERVEAVDRVVVLPLRGPPGPERAQRVRKGLEEGVRRRRQRVIKIPDDAVQLRRLRTNLTTYDTFRRDHFRASRGGPEREPERRAASARTKV